MFGNRNDETRSVAIRALKAAARPLFEANDDDAIVVTELQCDEPGCPPIETVVALLRAGAPARQVKIHKSAVDVTVDDLRAAIASAEPHAHHHSNA